MESVVECPRCHTQYRVRVATLQRPRPRFRCSRCGHVFTCSVAQARRRSLPAKREATAPEDDSPTLPFTAEDKDSGSHTASVADPRGDEATKIQQQNQSGRKASAVTEKDKDFAAGTVGPQDRFHFDEDESFTMDEEDVFAEPPEPPPGRPKPKGARRPPAEVRPEDDSGPFRALVLLLLGWVGICAVVTASLLAQPDRAQAWLARLPLIGRGVAEERLWARRVRLEGVEASMQTTKHGRPVLVISGRAVNISPTPLQAVQLSAELVNARGQVIDQKTIFAGNVVSVRVLRDLTPQEISILQQLNPPRQFVLPPGEAVSFAIAFFLDPSKTDETKQPSEFRVRVLAARRQG